MAFFRSTPAIRGLISGTLAVTTIAFAAACGPTVNGTPAAGEPDIRGFDVGKYSVIPLDYRSKYSHQISTGYALGAMRLAGFIATGSEIDPGLKYAHEARGLVSGGSVGSILSAASTPVLNASDMMFGFSMSAADTDPGTVHDQTVQRDVNSTDGSNPTHTTSVNLVVLQFPDAASAAKTAADIEAADFAVAADTNQPVTLDKYPEAKGHWRPGIPTLGATLSHGNYLINVFAQQPSPELAGLKTLTQQAISAQLPLLDQLPPLSPREALRQDHDPQGMFRRTLHPKDDPEPTVNTEWVLTPRGFLHETAAEEQWRTMIEAGGVDLISQAKGGALLMRARDAAAAQSTEDAFAGKFKNKAAAPQSVPDTACEENTDSKTAARFRCVVRYHRYVAIVASPQLTDAHQRAAAQYALLANSEWM